MNNTVGIANTANGISSLFSNISGSNNTAVGTFGLFSNTGDNNTALGAYALYNNGASINNIGVGYKAGYNVSPGNGDNIHIGNMGSAADSGAIRVGDPLIHTSFFAAGIRGVQTINNNALPVVIDSAGQLGTISSSRRFKEDIQDMGDSSQGLMRLRPVIFRYKQPYADGSKPIQYGLIAEEVAEVYPDLIARSADGQIESVKYQVLDSMLLNELQRQQVEIASQKELIQKLLDRMSKLETALTEVSGNR